MKAALYHRVSTVDQNPDAARSELHQAAQRLNAAVALSIEETGSGANNDRPGLHKILNAAHKGEIDVVFVWKLDRFGRSALDLLANIRALEDAGVRFIAITQGIDIKPGGDAMGRLLLTMLAAVAEFERDLIRERTRMGLERARQRGRVLGRPCVERPHVEIVRNLRAEGLSWPAIAEKLACSIWVARQSLTAPDNLVKSS